MTGVADVVGFQHPFHLRTSKTIIEIPFPLSATSLKEGLWPSYGQRCENKSLLGASGKGFLAPKK